MDNIIHDISLLIHSLFRGLDGKDDDLVGQCFAEDGTWMRQGKLLTGPAEIAYALSDRDPGRRSAHVITNMQIMPRQGGGWLARYYLTGWVALDLQPLRVATLLDCADEIDERPEGFRIVRKTARKLGDVDIATA